jgi:hypothetical protein
MGQRKLRVRLVGGLGNQLFQIAFGRLALTIYDSDFQSVIFDSSMPDRKSRDKTNALRSELILRQGEAWNSSNFVSETINALVASRNIGPVPNHDNGFLVSESCAEETILENGCTHFKSHFGLTGFFQNTASFLAWIQKAKPVSFRGAEPSCTPPYAALHVRRGDYNSATFGHLGFRYYRDALSLVNEAEIRVFSDDPAEAMRLIAELGDKRLRFADVGLSNIELLREMAGGSSIIGANSSLSWWAGNLGQPKRLRIAPEQWLRADPTNKLPGNGWVKLSPDWL